MLILVIAWTDGRTTMNRTKDEGEIYKIYPENMRSQIAKIRIYNMKTKAEYYFKF